jgi:stearoyl-CoA desaturase (Delta-9 desaturase)
MTANEATSGGGYKLRIKWVNLILLTYFHFASFYSFTLPKLWSTHIIGVIAIMFTGLGGSVGAHRYYTHKSFKANFPLRVILVILQTLSGQESAILWSRNHRIHHKFTDTNADPHNSKRGFFFSHVGWLLVKKHPDVIAAGKKIDMSDLTNDPLLSFQHKCEILLI